jgi:acyl-[acyl-carrier-protein] desaturase
MDARQLLVELEPLAGKLYDRHMTATKEWFPHELVPYDRARKFAMGETWDAADANCGGAQLTDAVRSALFVNLLTEDNLPYYFRDVERMFGMDSAWGTWAKWWTAEEGRHSIVMRDYMTVTRCIDLRALERARMVQVGGGETPAPHGPHDGMIYVCLQELATRISHRNTGKLVGDPVANEIMTRVAFDENLHYLFYRDLATAAIALDTSTMVIAMRDIVCNFAMPGTGIPGFTQHAAAIARAGIYNLEIHLNEILLPIVVKHWRLEELTGLSDEAERARDEIRAYIARLQRVVTKLHARQARAIAPAA